MKIDKTELQQLIKDYKKLNINKLALKYNLNKITIRKYLKSNNVFIERKNKFIKENPFKDLNNEEVQYWLGYLATDGNIHENRISLNQKFEDKDVIIKFKKFLKIKNKLIKRYCKKRNKTYSYSGISFRDTKTCEFLNNLGITKNKSFTLKMNFELNFNFIRGVIDGDGSIISNSKFKNKNIIKICSMSKDFINQIVEFLTKNNIKSKTYKYKKGIYSIYIGRKLDILELISKLYSNDNCICMKRKYNNAQEIRNNLI